MSYVTNADIELRQVGQSCGCAEIELWADGRRVQCPGVLAKHSKGAAKLRVTAASPAGSRKESVWVLWRHSGEQETHTSLARIGFDAIDAFRVVPPTAIVRDVEGVVPARCEVTWKELIQTQGEPRFEDLPPGVSVSHLETRGLAGGLREFRTIFEVRRSDPQSRAQSLTIRPSGLSPVPPPVVLNVLYRPEYVVEPMGILELEAAKQGQVVAVGDFAITARRSRIRLECSGVSLEPAALQPAVKVAWRTDARNRLCGRLHLLVRPEEPVVRGVLVANLAGEGGARIRIPWVFLRDSIRGSSSASEVPRSPTDRPGDGH